MTSTEPGSVNHNHQIVGGQVAGVVIRKDGKFLLVRESKEHVRGLWNLPAGHVDAGETLEEAAAREAFEETGFRVEVIKPLVKSYDKHMELNSFASVIIGGSLRFPEDEISAVKWFSLEEVEQLGKAIRHPWVIESIRQMERTTKA